MHFQITQQPLTATCNGINIGQVRSLNAVRHPLRVNRYSKSFSLTQYISAGWHLSGLKSLVVELQPTPAFLYFLAMLSQTYKVPARFSSFERDATGDWLIVTIPLKINDAVEIVGRNT